MLRRPRIGRGRRVYTVLEETPFITRGEVIKVKPLQGSFVNVDVLAENGNVLTHTLGLNEDFTWPKLGECIQVVGTIRNKRHLTKEWKKL